MTTRALPALALLVLLLFAVAGGCSEEESSQAPDAGAIAEDASLPGGDASASGPDAAGPAHADVGEGTPDSSVPGADAGGAAAEDASADGRDASAAGEDAAGVVGADAAAVTEPDAGPLASPAVARLGSPEDAVASYLMDAAHSEWNMFFGAHVPVGRHFDGAHVSYHTALRFPAVMVPRGATITSAKLSFFPHSAVDGSNNLWLNLYAEKVGNSSAFDPLSYQSGRPDQRAKTVAHVDHWLVRCNSGCTDLTEWDCLQRKLDCWDPAVSFTCPKDLKALVQEVVDLSDWSAGNAMTLFLVNAATDQDGANYRDHRTIVGYDPTPGASQPPQLVVEFAP
ncbi:MAG: hypothetical protein HY901_30490 [Deltaproteobacteria bacterium]|nr:hypothetical protein [Deltaproteobacteria bacterium]